MASTKINLEYPYCNDWKYGYVVTNRQNRKTLILWNSSKNRSSTQYARYLLATNLGRYLTPTETVDHIDGDKTNNDISNLQILSRGDNIRKSQKLPLYETVCYICGKKFYKARNLSKANKEKLDRGELTCSRQCGYKKTSLSLLKK